MRYKPYEIQPANKPRRFVRLYYVEDLTCNDAELTLALTFPFEAELVLKFPGGCAAPCFFLEMQRIPMDLL